MLHHGIPETIEVVEDVVVAVIEVDVVVEVVEIGKVNINFIGILTKN